MVNVNRRHFFVAGLGSAAVVGLAACQQQKPGTDGAQGSDSGKKPAPKESIALPSTDWDRAEASAVKDGGLLRLSVTQVPDNWNSDQTNGNLADLSKVRAPMGYAQAIIQAENGAIKVNPDYIVEAKLKSESPQVISVKFNKKAVWEDGSPITVKDFQAYQKALSGTDKAFQLVSTQGWEDIKEIKQTDDEFSCEIHYAKTFADWIGYVYPNLPASITTNAEKFNKGYIDGPTPSQGPFKVTKYDKSGGVIELGRNPKWWGKAPKLEQIIFKQTTQEQEPAAFGNKELDAIDVITGDVYETAKKRDDAVLKTSNGLTWTHVTLNTKMIPDVAVRKAIATAINRDIIAQAVIGPLKAPVVLVDNIIFMPGQEGYENSWDVKTDKKAAEKVLTDAGYKKGSDGVYEKDGKKLILTVTVPAGIKSNTDRAAQVQKDLNAIGMKVSIKPVPPNEYFKSNVIPRKFDMVTFSWVGGTFAITGGVNLWTSGSEQNFTSWGDPKLDEIAKKANSTLDQAERIKLANEFSKGILGNYVVVPVYATPNVVAIKNGLVNYGPSQFESVDWTIVGFKA